MITALSLLLFTMSGCFDYEDVEFKGVENITVVERTEDEIKLKVDVKVDNPNKFNIKVKSSTLDIYINDKYVGKTDLVEKIVVKKKAEEVYGVVLKASARDLLKAAIGSLGGLLKGDVKVRLTGDVKGSVYGMVKKVPVDFEEKINLKDFL